MEHTNCKNCGKEFIGYKTRKFCTLDCAHEFNGKNKLTGGNRSSLDFLIKKYGKELGEVKCELPRR